MRMVPPGRIELAGLSLTKGTHYHCATAASRTCCRQQEYDLKDSMVARTGLEPVTSALWARRSTY